MQIIIDIMFTKCYIFFEQRMKGYFVVLENKVRELRARFRMTQSDLAKKVGITRQTVGLIEKGDYAPSVLLALKIAQTFDTTVENVFWIKKGGQK